MDEMTIVDPKGRPKYRLTDKHKVECLHPGCKDGYCVLCGEKEEVTDNNERTNERP